MGSISVWLVFLFLCCGLPHTSYAAVYYIAPHIPNPDCPQGEPCFTIDEYALGDHFVRDDNITLLFLSGEHNLTAQSLEITNKILLDMRPIDTQAEVVVHLLNKTHIAANNIVRMEFTGLKIMSVKNDTTDCVTMSDIGTLSVNELVIEFCQLSLQGEMKATITELTAHRSNIVSILSQNNITIDIKDSEFYLCTLNISDNNASQVFNDDTIVTALSLTSSMLSNSLVAAKLQSSVVIVRLLILDTNITSQNHSNSETGIKIDAFGNATLHVLIQNCRIIGNSQGVAVKAQGNNNIELTVDHCHISENGRSSLQYMYTGGIDVSCTPESRARTVTNITSTTLSGGYGMVVSGGGKESVLGIASCVFTLNSKSALLFQHTSVLVKITGTVISENENGVLVNEANMHMIIMDSIFHSNIGVSLGVEAIQLVSSVLSNITLSNVTFFNNTNLFPKSGTIQADNSIKLNVENSCVFRGNQRSSIQAFETTITLSGDILFENNTAYEGAAILLSHSMLKLKSVNNTNTNIIIANNTAKNVGGAIFIERAISFDVYSGSSCFFEIEGVYLDELKNSIVNVTLAFCNNTAQNGGVDIFGATPNSYCPVDIKVKNNTQQFCSADFQELFFKFPSESTLSSITTEPKRVCFCNSSQLMCASFSHIFYNTTRYPGEEFTLSLAVVGLAFGTTTGPIYATLLSQANQSIGSGQHVRQIPLGSCSQLNFIVNSPNSNEIIVLTTDDIDITQVENRLYVSSLLDDYEHNPYHVIPLSLLTVPVYINVTLLECPSGFELTGEGRCDCSRAVRAIGINNCSIDESTVYITRSKNQWIKHVINPDGILVNKHCPFSYCRQEAVLLDPNNPDKQCALSRSGILCGGCPDNLSLAIGSSRCIECDDYYHLTLLIVFAAAGILLVLFIKILDLTVSRGTINGLIFTANIIWANQNILFPAQIETSALLLFLKTFIAWLNLDLGIETCFIQHLDGYWKTWLQFAFPAYIWSIAGLIIIVAKYSTRATVIFGNNSVAVLSTLFLLAYAKLLRTILVVLKFTMLDYPSEQRIVWSFDGNVPYFGLKHMILFGVAVFILLVLWVPYTFVLLFIQCLRKQSHQRGLRWVNRMAPFFDSYLGPLKFKHHYWVGLGLFARLFLILTAAVVQAFIPLISTPVLIVTVTVLCLLVVSVYKQWQLSVLESCFLVNLVMFSSGALVIEIQGGSKDTLACVSLGITFVLFLVIIGYHVWRRLDSLVKRIKNNRHGYEEINIIQPLPHTALSQQNSATKSDCDLRESLLEDTKI